MTKESIKETIRMVKNHMKRIAAPRTWKIFRKESTFVTRPNPGAHTKELAVSLNTFLKELVGLAHTTKETKYLLTQGEVLVNGKRRRDHKFQTGFLDVISIPSADKHYVLTINRHGKLTAKEIPGKEANKILLNITGKTHTKKGKVQLNTSTGRNILINPKEVKKYSIGDSIIVTLPGNKITEDFKKIKGNQAFIFTGKHAGKQGEIKEVLTRTIIIKTKDEELETRKDYVVVIGEKKPAMELLI